jgi:hypothetical protein
VTVQRNAVDRVRALMKGHKPGRDDAPFHRDLKAVVAEGVKQNSLDESDAALLFTAVENLEAWSRNTSLTAGEAFVQWLTFYEAAADHFPSSLFEAFLQRLPKKIPSTFDWTPLLVERRDKRLIELLVKGRIVRTADLVRVAKASPAEFYLSPGLDVLLDQRTAAPRAVWSELAAGHPRGIDVLDASEALAESFAVDRSADASGWLTRFLAENPAARPGVLRQLLRDPEAIHTLVRYLSTGALKAAGKKQKAMHEAIAPVASELLVACEQSITEQKRTAPTATLILGIFQLAAAASPNAFSSETRDEIERSAAHVVQPLVVEALRIAEDAEGKSNGAPNVVPLVVRGEQIHAGVQEYLRNLPRGADGDLEPAERALRYERFLGRREVIQGLLSILDDSNESEGLRERMDAVLFNVGVRPLGVSDADTTFDARKHEPVSPGILPGSPVKIVQPGWVLGADDQVVILSKARVAPTQ